MEIIKLNINWDYINQFWPWNQIYLFFLIHNNNVGNNFGNGIGSFYSILATNFSAFFLLPMWTGWHRTSPLVCIYVSKCQTHKLSFFELSNFDKFCIISNFDMVDIHGHSMWSHWVRVKLIKLENDHLTEFHLTFSVDQKFLIIWAFDRILFWRLIKSFNNESFIFCHLTEFFETFQLIEIF